MLARRNLLGASLAAAGVALGLPGAPAAASAPAISPDHALARLMRGNQRWVSGELADRDHASGRRRRVAGGQHPVAVVFSCIDSRVPPEYVFDQDLGDLFVVRSAGEALDPLVSGSLEYGPAHGTPLVMVLGHSSCGAIGATVESIEDEVRLAGHLADVVAALTPAYDVAKRDFGPHWSRRQRVEATAQRQVQLAVARLRADPVLFPLVQQGRTRIAGGLYSLASGRVRLV